MWYFCNYEKYQIYMGTVVQQTTRPYSGQWTLPQRSSEPLSPPSWTFSLHDAPAKPTVSWRTPPIPPTVSSSSYHQEDVPEHQSPLRQTAQQNCPEPKSPRPPLKPHATPTSWTWTVSPTPQTSPTLPHQRKKLSETFFCAIQSVLHTGEWACTNHLQKHTLLYCTRHFSHTAVCTQSQKRLNNICMFTCSCTTNHLVLFPQQLLDLTMFLFAHVQYLCEAFV